MIEERASSSSSKKNKAATGEAADNGNDTDYSDSDGDSADLNYLIPQAAHLKDAEAALSRRTLSESESGTSRGRGGDSKKDDGKSNSNSNGSNVENSDKVSSLKGKKRSDRSVDKMRRKHSGDEHSSISVDSDDDDDDSGNQLQLFS
jgi:hypothetical protein